MTFSHTEFLLLGLIFVWTGFVRTGLGFGGAALGLPLLLLLGGSPVYWLPLIGIHLLFFASLTLKKSLKKVDWNYLKKSLAWIILPALAGVFGLISLPDKLVIIFVYLITIFYGFIWSLGIKIASHRAWIDKILLLLGGYVAGISLTGAPLIVAVFMRHITKEKLRNTLFVLWFILVSLKMATFVAFEVFIDWKLSLSLLPVAAIGHIIGLKLHQKIIQNDALFKRMTISTLIVSKNASNIVKDSRLYS
ncbi:MAG: TSUP family transporter [Candidatus Thioglobus sp.]|nr:TSUP family transporter [Candidatus Thioglobus sp.]